MVQLSHPYMTTGKPIALTIQTFVGKVMSLLFNVLSRLVIAFLPRRSVTAAAAAKSLQSCLILCNPMYCSTLGFPVPHQLPEPTHVHRLSGAIQPSHPLSSPSPPAFNLSQSFPPNLSGSFPMNKFITSGGQSIGVSASASVLPMTIQNWFPLGLTGLISLQFKGLSRVFSNTTVQKHQFFGAQLSL